MSRRPIPGPRGNLNSFFVLHKPVLVIALLCLLVGGYFGLNLIFSKLEFKAQGGKAEQFSQTKLQILCSGFRTESYFLFLTCITNLQRVTFQAGIQT